MKSIKTPSVLSYGELLWDLLPNGKMLGGAPANFTFHLRSLGAQATLVSKVGNDELGAGALSYLQKHGLDISFVQQDTLHPTGTVPVVLDEKGIPDFTIVPGVAYDYIELTEELRKRAEAADMICFGTLIQRSCTSRHTLYALLEACPGARRFLDINLRKDCYSEETIRSSLEAADIVKLNEDEARLLTRMLSISAPDFSAFADGLFERFNLKTCIITRGENGVYAKSASKEEVDLPGRKVDVIDTIGSGDAFSAGFVYALLLGSPLAACCTVGNTLGALVAERAGGMTSVPREDVLGLGD